MQTNTDDHNINEHLIIVGRDGEALECKKSPTKVLSEVEFESHVDAMVCRLEVEKPKKGILIFVHGGLNPYSHSFDRAIELAPKLKNDGYYPIFVNWRSGLVDCYREHLFSIRQGRTHRHYGWLTWLYYLIADLGRAVFRIPAALYLQVINDCKPYFPKENPDGLNSVALFEELEKRHSKGRGQRLAISLGEDVRTNSERWSQLSRLVATYPLKVFAGAIVDALGTSAWGNMLRRTKTLFHTPQEFDIRDNRDDSAIKQALDSMPTGALAKFLNRLIAHLGQDSCPYRVTMVGHSMGTIVLNRVLKDFPSLPCANLIYLAAACSILDFVDSAVPFLQLHEETRVFSFCLHPVAEELESNAFELAPRGSLLVWIDNFLSSPETTVDRRFGVWENILQATHMIPFNVRGRVTLKAFSVGAKTGPGEPQTHSDLGRLWNSKWWSTEEDCNSVLR